MMAVWWDNGLTEQKAQINAYDHFRLILGSCSARVFKVGLPNAEIAKVTQKSQKISLKGIFGCFFCEASAPSAFGCPICLAR
jgi:hypothetical protein